MCYIPMFLGCVDLDPMTNKTDDYCNFMYHDVYLQWHGEYDPDCFDICNFHAESLSRDWLYWDYINGTL